MSDTFFLVMLGGAILVLLYSGIQIHRRYPRIKTTKGSKKWSQGHVAGCVLYAPENDCICDKLIAKRGKLN